MIRRLTYIKHLEAEIITLRHALDNAARYVALLENLKKAMTIRIDALEKENKDLQGHLNGRHEP